MAITLNDMKTGMSDKLAAKVVESFIRQSEILELMPFDNCVSPDGGGGSTLTYGYIQEKLPSTTAFRALNNEYTANEATIEKKTVDLAVVDFTAEKQVIKSALIGLAVSALSAGISAVMNLQKPEQLGAENNTHKFSQGIFLLQSYILKTL